MIEFAYNNSYLSSIGMTPYEALYDQRCRTPVCWTKLNEHKVIGPDIVKDTEAKVQVIRQRLKAANDRQKSYTNLKRKDIEYEVIKCSLRYLYGGRYLDIGRKGS